MMNRVLGTVQEKSKEHLVPQHVHPMDVATKKETREAAEMQGYF